MTAYGFMIPILPGQEEPYRQFLADLQGLRRAEYETTWQHLGMRTNRIWLQPTPQGSVAIVYLEADDMDRVFTEIATSDAPFLGWWRAQVLAIHGVDFSQPLPAPPNEQLFDWSEA